MWNDNKIFSDFCSSSKFNTHHDLVLGGRFSGLRILTFDNQMQHWWTDPADVFDIFLTVEIILAQWFSVKRFIIYCFQHDLSSIAKQNLVCIYIRKRERSFSGTQNYKQLNHQNLTHIKGKDLRMNVPSLHLDLKHKENEI